MSDELSQSEGTEERRSSKPIRKAARLVFAGLDLLTAGLAAGLAAVLWTGSIWYTIALVLWAVLQLASAAGLVVGSRRGRRAARIASWFQLGLLGVIIVGFALSAGYLWGLYGNLGTGIAVVFVVLIALLIELMGLLPIYKLRALGLSETPAGRLARILRWAIPGGLSLALLCAMAMCRWADYPDWSPTDLKTKEALGAALLSVVKGDGAQASPPSTKADLHVVRVYSAGRERQRFTVRGDGSEVTAAVRERLAGTPGPRPAVVVDRVVAVGPMLTDASVLSALSVVPGLDGIGALADGEETVLLPQDLVLRRMLTSQTPLSFVQDFKMGVRFDQARAELCKQSGKADTCTIVKLRRIRTESWVTTDRGVTPLERGRPARSKADEELSSADALAGARAGGEYILRSVERDGRYTYKLYPVTGQREAGSYSIPRHAGTTWFLLLMAQRSGDGRYGRAAQKALDWLRSQMRPCGSGHWCIMDGATAKLSSQALSLIAFVEHARTTESERYMAPIVQLSNIILALQKSDGDFRFYWDPEGGPVTSGRRRFYAAGQATLALSMAARLTGEARYRDAAKRALDFIAGPYWSFFAGDLFFIEEHWTCLAALEGFRLLGDRRHAELCVDIGSFYRHLQHRPGETAFGDYVGGVGFSPFFPPHTTPTASRAEALIAAYTLSRELGAPDQDILCGIREAIGFLLHSQYTEDDSYLFAHPIDAVGGVPWNSLEPTIRIDTVQHASAVFLAGAELL